MGVSPETIRVSANFEKVEEELRSLIYTTLIELSYARTEEKAAIVGLLNQACCKLSDLIIHGQIPEL
jgi:hypothetical protein